MDNVAIPRPLIGQEGARRFWQEYREAFRDVESTFRDVIVAGDRAALEWTTRGTSAEGRPIDYDGVSNLETDGRSVTRFRAYFHAGESGRQAGRPMVGAAEGSG